MNAPCLKPQAAPRAPRKSSCFVVKGCRMSQEGIKIMMLLMMMMIMVMVPNMVTVSASGLRTPFNTVKLGVIFSSI